MGRHRKAEETFSRLTQKEVDNIIVDTLNNSQGRGGKVSNRQLWSADTKEIRRLAIIDYIRKGYSKTETREAIRERWGISTECFAVYYKDAINSLIEPDIEVQAREREKQLERLDGILKTCVAKGDMKNALYAADLINKLQGLYTDKKDIKLSECDIKFTFGGE